MLEGTPPVPPELAARLRPYMESRTAVLSALSEDARTVLITTRFGNVASVHRVRQPLGARTQVTFEAEPILGAGFVPGTNDAMVELRDVGGNERYQIFRRDLKSGRITQLTDPASRTEGVTFSEDGARMAFASNARNGKDFDIWIGDGLSLASNKLVLEGKGQWTPRAFSPDAQTLLVKEYVSIADSRLYLWEIASGTLTKVTAEAPVAAYRDAVFDRSGKRLFVLSDRGGERVELFAFELATKAWTNWSAHLPWNVEELALSPDGKTLAVIVNEDGFGVVRLFETRSGKELAAPQLPRGLISGLRYARKANVIGFTFASSVVAGDAYTYDVGKKALTRWTESELGGLDASSFVAVELVRYRSFDDREIPAFAYVPRGPGPFPVIVSIHGGPESQARPGFVATLQFYVRELGFAVLVPNVRGSDGYGRSYLALDDGFKREDSVKDIGALLDWIGTQPRLDSKRVAVMGGSYGGYMVLASLARFGDRLRAGIDLVGISNFLTFLANTAEYRRDLRRAEYGDERDPAMHAFLETISPTTNAAAIQSALFVAQGANDPRVPAGEATQIAAAVKKNGHEVWTMLALNEGHGFAKKENRDLFTLLAALFMSKQLGVEPGTP